MTEKDLKKLNRRQLLELLLQQTERADRLQEQLDEAKRKIQDKTLMETEAGSIAEASLKLNGVFEAAEAAAAQYLENIQKLSTTQSLINEQTQAEARKKAEDMIAQAEQRCKEREAEADKKLEEASARIRQMYSLLDDAFRGFKVKEHDA